MEEYGYTGFILPFLKVQSIQLVPIKTLLSLHAKFRVINENFETNLDCTIITRN